MKVTYRIPAKAQYGYIELDTEVEGIEDALAGYEDAVRAYQGSDGLPTPEFNATIDEYMNTGHVLGGLELWGRMSDNQKFCFQEVKKSMKRLEAKNNK